jgi:predicted secreted protein
MSVLNRSAITLALLGSLFASNAALADEPRYNQISLRAEVSQEVAHDLMQVTLFTEEQSNDPAQLATNVTKRLNAALERARADKNVKVRLGNRHSYPVYDDKGQKITAWRERGELRLEGADFAALSQLTADLLGQLNIASMDFGISPKARSQSEDELLKQAVAAFKARAELAAEALGGKGYKLVSLSLDGGGFQPVMMRGAAVADSMSFAKAEVAPSIEAGSSQVSMNANGVIEVQLP